MSRYIIDSYALLASYWREPGAVHVEQILSGPDNRCWMTAINIGEAYYRVAEEETLDIAEEALTWIGSLPIVSIDADFSLSIAAARIKARYPISYADCFAAALAQRLDARIVTGDPEFERLEAAGIADVEWLTRRPRRPR